MSEALLRAMAHNYRHGHRWDHLDTKAVTDAADLIRDQQAEIARLRAIESLRGGVGDTRCDQYVLDSFNGERKCMNKRAPGDTLCKRHRATAELTGYMMSADPNTGLMSSEGDWTVIDCPYCGKCVKYSKKAASSKDAYRDLTTEVTALRDENRALLAKSATPELPEGEAGVGRRDAARNEAFNLADTVVEHMQCGHEQKARDAIMEAFAATPQGNLLEVIRRIKLRIHFIDWPGESMFNGGTDEKPHWIPDWRYEIALIENALHGTPVTVTNKPTDTKRRIEVMSAHTSQPAAAQGVEEGLPVSWADFWISKGNWQVANDYETFNLADQWLSANLAAAPQPQDAAACKGDVCGLAKQTGITCADGECDRENGVRTPPASGGVDAKLLGRARAAVRVLRTILHKGNLRTGAEVSEQLITDLDNVISAAESQEQIKEVKK